MTLVEVVVSILIASFLTSALVWAYVRGVELFDKSSSRFQMLVEGTARLRKIESNIRQADRMSITSSSDPLRSRLSLHWGDKDGDGFDEGDIEYYVNSLDHTLRESNHQVGVNTLHQMFLPMSVTKRNRRDPTGQPSYRVAKLKFEDGDDLINNYNPNYSSIPYILIITMVLEDDLGNSVALSSTVSRLNNE
jgi:hypothetical protein